ncbi:MAG TPA: type I-E CRISPR-associated protein Cse1/CasA, partial [Protaetiibacter sp.]|nr:type I-E CRISPR-associated protein Cse1/CasA [Protaetiibacter sp.]
MSGHDLRAMPWIAVSDLDGRRRMVGLRELLCDAHQLRDVHDDDPTVLMALHRFLPTVAALVCARYPWRDRTHSWASVAEQGFDPEYVSAALDELGAALELNGTFMQDAQVTGPVRAIGELHPLAPSGATKAWWHKNTPASLGPPDAARHLIAAWFCSTAAAGRSAGEYLDEPGVTYRPRGNP